MPAPPNPNLFDPPTAQRLAQHLEQHTPIVASPWQSRLPVLVLLLILITVLVANNPGFALLPMLGVIGVMVYLSSRARAAQALQKRVTRAWELAMIRRYREALGQAWELVPACRTQPELHGRVVTVIAHILGELGKDDAAEVAYGYLLDRLPADHPIALRLRVQRAVAALCGDRLADADDALRRLRSPAESSNDPALAASYRMARLLQDVRTGHFADAVEHADETTEAIKPLGIEAGYGHGLLALCYQQLAERQATTPEPTDGEEKAQAPDLRQDLARSARLAWDRATLLIPTSALLYRHPDLLTLPAKLSQAPADTTQPRNTS